MKVSFARTNFGSFRACTHFSEPAWMEATLKKCAQLLLLNSCSKLEPFLPQTLIPRGVGCLLV